MTRFVSLLSCSAPVGACSNDSAPPPDGAAADLAAVDMTSTDSAPGRDVGVDDVALDRATMVLGVLPSTSISRGERVCR